MYIFNLNQEEIIEIDAIKIEFSHHLNVDKVIER
jgi:hypothetical protein